MELFKCARIVRVRGRWAGVSVDSLDVTNKLSAPSRVKLFT
jgi:hypothetical protein